MQIDSIGNAQGQGNTTIIAQSKGNASLFSSMLASVLNESARTLGDFPEGNDGMSVLDTTGSLTGQESLLNLQNTAGGTGDMLALVIMGMLLGSGMGADLISALLGGQASLYNPFLTADGAEPGADEQSADEASHLQASGLLAYTAQAGSASPIPANAWVAVSPTLVSHVGERDPGTYRNVISQFGVETNERYRVNKQGTGDTYCNIFAWDVTRTMGAEIPHYVNAQTGEPAAAGQAGAMELDANATSDWLNNYGKKYGWVEVSAEKAQAYANEGMPAVTSWKNPGGHGHMQVVSPSENGGYDAERGVAIAQAGRHLYNYNYITSVYGQGTLGEVQYFAHI